MFCKSKVLSNGNGKIDHRKRKRGTGISEKKRQKCRAVERGVEKWSIVEERKMRVTDAGGRAKEMRMQQEEERRDSRRS